jgi:tRNA nucleotidyltransferase/poly(A) polymerase
MARQHPPKASSKRELVRAQRRAAAAAARMPLIQAVFDLAERDQTSLCLVGGTVRDLMLDRETHDLDYAVDGDGLAIARRVANALGGAYVPLDLERRTGRVVLRREDRAGTCTDALDFASFRGPTLEADLCDRDLTINAMALCRAADGSFTLVDPLGGSSDLFDGVLRATSAHAFADDPVRTLRAVRQGTQFGCRLEAQTRAWLVEAVPRLSTVSPERIRDEWFRILAQPRAGDAVQQLQQLDLLAQIAPPAAALARLPAPAAAPGDALSHAMEMVRAVEAIWEALQAPHRSASELPATACAVAAHLRRRYEAPVSDQRPRLALLKCAALLHRVDLARPHACAAPGEQSAAQGAAIAAELARSWRCSNAETEMLRITVATRGRAVELAQDACLDRRTIHRYYRQAGPHGVDAAYLAFAEAWASHAQDLPATASRPYAERLARLWAAFYCEHDEVIAPPPLLSGHDLLQLGMVPGPQIGALLAHIREEQAAGEIATRAQALGAARAWLGRNVEPGT